MFGCLSYQPITKRILGLPHWCLIVFHRTNQNTTWKRCGKMYALTKILSLPAVFPCEKVIAVQFHSTQQHTQPKILILITWVGLMDTLLHCTWFIDSSSSSFEFRTVLWPPNPYISILYWFFFSSRSSTKNMRMLAILKFPHLMNAWISIS